MRNLSDIETAAEALSLQEQRELLEWLQRRVRENGKRAHRRSVLDIAPVSLGRALKPFPDDDDLLGDMLEGRS